MMGQSTWLITAKNTPQEEEEKKKTYLGGTSSNE
jgi:hypothetical protein